MPKIKLTGIADYNYLKIFLDKYGYTVNSSYDEIMQTDKVRMTCNYGHITTVTLTTYNTKRRKIIDKIIPIQNLCSICNLIEKKELLMSKYNGILKNRNSKHTIIVCNNSCDLTYICGRCENIVENMNWQNLSGSSYIYNCRYCESYKSPSESEEEYESEEYESKEYENEQVQEQKQDNFELESRISYTGEKSEDEILNDDMLRSMFED